jgi:hypothetical protein
MIKSACPYRSGAGSTESPAPRAGPLWNFLASFSKAGPGGFETFARPLALSVINCVIRGAAGTSGQR